MLYLWLFKTNLFISSFTFGGGYVVVPMIRRYFVQQKKYLTEEELLNMAAVAQSSPGAIAINLSVLAGYRTAGMAGALISAAGALMPPLIILAFISMWYEAFAANALIAAVLKGMQAGVAALMVDLIIDMSQAIAERRSWLLNLLIPAAFIANFILGINVALILGLSALLCAGQTMLSKSEHNKKGGVSL